MSGVIALLALSSAIAYIIAIVLVLRRRWQPYAGSRVLNTIATASFAAARAFPQQVIVQAFASAVIALALIVITRRSSAAGALLAAIPLLAMLALQHKKPSAMRPRR